MKYNKYLAVILTTVTFLYACVDDKGNYAYLDMEDIVPAEVHNIEPSYTKYMMDTLHISPRLADGSNEADYDYLWYIYSPDMAVDTLGYEKELSYLISISPRTNYTITFRITNKRTGVFNYHYSALNVIAPFDEGWYITKDIDNMTDIDMVKPDETVLKDILKNINGQGVPGEGVLCADTRYISVMVPLGSSTGQDTILKNHNCIYLMTRSTVQLYDIVEMKLLNKFGDLFMEAPTAAPQELSCTRDFKVIVNNNVPYVLDTRSSSENIGKWGVAVAGDAQIDPTNICRTSLGCFLVFDKNTNSLKMLNTLTNTFGALGNAGLYPCNNMDYNMVFMREKVGMMQGGVSIMKKKNTEEYYGFTIKGYNGGGLWEIPGMPAMLYTNPIQNCVRIPDGSKVLDAKIYGTHNNMDMIYFSKGDNEVWCYNLTSPREDRIVSFPAGETVTYINSVVKYINGGEEWYFAVLTVKDGKWKFYLHNFQPSSQLVVPEPVAVYSGEGTPRHVHYRSLTSTTSF
ncbi:MAG: hypothetical protein LBU22_15605 [Dysgonamonadaceae bacterium]|jgi:hypothetical protein|nr:hypothetical protein [Dysgonamonadaceae bacterium]